MSGGEFVLAGAAVAGAAYLLRRRGAPAARATWDVPAVQRQQADRLAEAAALYGSGHDAEAKIALRDRALDWDLIRRAAGAQPLDPTARRIAQTLERDGSGMFLSELHRLSMSDRDIALNALIHALNDYTGSIDGGTS